jgi:hypothetical protein
VIGAAGLVSIRWGLSDRFGRRPVILVAWLAVCIFRAYAGALRSGPALYFACVVLASSSTLAGTTALGHHGKPPRQGRAGGFD